jgi:hypothetical protein
MAKRISLGHLTNQLFDQYTMLYALCVIVHSIGDFNLHIPGNALLFTVLVAIVVAPIPLDNASRVK